VAELVDARPPKWEEAMDTLDLTAMAVIGLLIAANEIVEAGVNFLLLLMNISRSKPRVKVRLCKDQS
jgi:hypothetical protein